MAFEQRNDISGIEIDVTIIQGRDLAGKDKNFLTGKKTSDVSKPNQTVSLVTTSKYSSYIHPFSLKLWFCRLIAIEMNNNIISHT